jgi:hypothetical protein
MMRPMLIPKILNRANIGDISMAIVGVAKIMKIGKVEDIKAEDIGLFIGLTILSLVVGILKSIELSMKILSPKYCLLRWA